MDKERDIKTIVKNTNVKKALQVKVYNSFEDLRAIQQEWDEFLESVGSEIILTYDWCKIWWKYYGKNRDLRIFVFRSNNKLVGIIPLFFEKIWLGPIFVRAGKIVGSDFTLSQFSIPLANSYIVPVIEKFSELLSEDNWDIMHIGPIAGLYNHYDKLMNVFEESLGHSYYVSGKDTGVQTYFKLTNTWEKYLAGLKKKERQLIKNTYRKIDKKKLTLNTDLALANNFREKFEAFVQTHRSQWQELGKAGHFGDWPNSLEFHREVASVQQKHGRLRLLEVRLSDDCFAYQYSYKFADKYLSILPARSTKINPTRVSLGKVIFSEQAKRAIKENVLYIDSMRGKYEYKLRLGGKLLPLRSIYIFQKKSFALSRVFLFRILSRFLDLCYYKIWYCRVAPRLPIKHRPLWRIWMRTNGLS